MNIVKIIVFLKNLLIPGVCLSCGTGCSHETGLCRTCRDVFLRESHEICPECGSTASECECGMDFFAHTSTVGGKKFAVLTFYKSRSDYSESNRLTERMIYDLKSSGTYADFFAAELDEKIRKLFAGNGEDLKTWRITYIPRTEAKKKKNGIDHSEETARRLARRLGIPFDCIFSREMGEEQKYLSKNERSENMEKSMYIHRKPVKNGKYLLVDDIITSGASVETAARLLRFEGADAVFPAVIARTMKPESGV